MTCVICKQGEVQAGEATVTLHRERTIVVLKGVPAEVCENCGEYYLSDAVARRAYAVAEAAVQAGAEVEIRRYAA